MTDIHVMVKANDVYTARHPMPIE